MSDLKRMPKHIGRGLTGSRSQLVGGSVFLSIRYLLQVRLVYTEAKRTTQIRVWSSSILAQAHVN